MCSNVRLNILVSDVHIVTATAMLSWSLCAPRASGNLAVLIVTDAFEMSYQGLCSYVVKRTHLKVFKLHNAEIEKRVCEQCRFIWGFLDVFLTELKASV